MAKARMRILLLCNKSPWPPKDGGAAATLNLIKSLSDLNVAVTVFAINTSKHPAKPGDIPAEYSKSIDYHLIDLDTGIDYFRLILNFFFSGKPYNIEKYRNKHIGRALKKIINDSFDLIQIDGLAMHHYLPVIRKLTAVPVVFRPHNVENIIWLGLCKEERNILRKLYFKNLAGRIKKTEKDIINLFDAVIPISKNDLNWFKSKGLTKPSFVFSGGYSMNYTAGYETIRPKSVCFIGALDWSPNINGLTWFIKSVWPLVTTEIPDAEFIIAGRNASEKSVSGFTGTNVKYAGEPESSYDFLKDKSIMVVPLFSGSGIRMKILEGMSMGKCIVATPKAAEGLEFEDGKDLFIAPDASSFAEQVVRLLRNQTQRNSAGENAVNNVRKNYNILVTSEQLVNFYRELNT
jgi:glycosyltransferase involved in cell wall biosynthesis